MSQRHADRRPARLLGPVLVVTLVAVLTACSPRPAPLAARTGSGGGLEAVVPDCEVGTYAVLLYPAGEGPGAAPLQQGEVPDGGGAVPMDVRLEPGERYELTLAQTSFELDALALEVLAEDEVLAADAGEDTARIMSVDEWASAGDEFCSAGDREVLLLGGLVLGVILVAVAVVIGSVRAWRARRRPRVLLTFGLLMMGCLGWGGLVALWVRAAGGARSAPPGVPGPWVPPGPWPSPPVR